jgi:hypothetical protein
MALNLFLYPHGGEKRALAGDLKPQLVHFVFGSIVIPPWWQYFAPGTS